MRYCYYFNVNRSFSGIKLFLFLTMPSSRCVVQDCSNASDHTAGISLHKSPKNESLRRIWVKFVQTKRANFNQGCAQLRFIIIRNFLPCLKMAEKARGEQRIITRNNYVFDTQLRLVSHINPSVFVVQVKFKKS